MRSSTKEKLRALRRELLQAEAEAEAEDAKSEAEEEAGGASSDWPLEADDPPEERSHPAVTPNRFGDGA